jgi:hypothetical protein
MEITSFAISDDNTQLDLTIEDAATVASLRLWTDETYKDFSQAIDLSAKLTGSATENIVITLADLGIPYFDGIYFIEAEDPDELALDYVADLTRFKECVLDRIMYLSTCNDCLLDEDIDLFNAYSFYKGLEYALELRLIDEIIALNDALNKYCTENCSICGKFSNVDSVTSEDSIGSSLVTLHIDGGSSSD